MQASGQYGVPPDQVPPQYAMVGRATPPSHSHMFNLSHDMSLSPSSAGHGQPHHGHSPHPQHHHQQQQQQQQQLQQHHHHHHQQHLQQHPQHSQHHAVQQSQQAQLQHTQQQQQAQAQSQSQSQQQHSLETPEQQMVQQLGLASADSLKAPSPIASRPPPNSFNKALVVAVTDQSLAAEDQDGLGDEGERGTAANRWPRQETLALLKIRSDMDATFRDSSLKGPLWEEISRKLAEMGYHRSAKKCKEKFENVHKYYKRTRDGKAGRQDGKNYRFFSQLEALYGNANGPSNTGNNTTTNMFAGGSHPGGGTPDGAVGIGASIAQGDRGGFLLTRGVAGASRTGDRPVSAYRPEFDYSSGLNFSSESSDDDYEDPRETENQESRKRKRKSSGRFMVFFENLMKKVIDKQEQMQQKFLEALERREHDRMIREEAWKRQEMARMSREHELRAQERSVAAIRDAALVTFLQKVTGQTLQLPPTAIPAQPLSAAPDVHEDQSDRDLFDPNSKRWPKPEVQTLIKLRSGLQPKFLEPGPKGPLWEEISAGMSCLGYSRSAKRCKEKWENINKYYKKAKESNKKRPEDAKTCPYFHQLDSLYRKGLLGAPHAKQLLANKPHDHAEDDLMEQPSRSNTRDDSGHAQGGDSEMLAIMPPEESVSAPVGTSTSNVGVTVHFFPSTEDRNNSDRGLKKVKMKPSLVDSSTPAPQQLAADFDGMNGVKTFPGSTRSINYEGLQAKEIQTDSQIVHQQSAMEHQDYEKMGLEREARQQHQVQQQKQQGQLHPKERAPQSTRDASFMSVVHKFSNDPPEYNIAASANTE